MTDIRPIQKSQTIDILIDATYTYLPTVSGFISSCFPMPALYDIARTLYYYISVAINLKSYIPFNRHKNTYPTRSLVKFCVSGIQPSNDKVIAK